MLPQAQYWYLINATLGPSAGGGGVDYSKRSSVQERADGGSEAEMEAQVWSKNGQKLPSEC